MPLLIQFQKMLSWCSRLAESKQSRVLRHFAIKHGYDTATLAEFYHNSGISYPFSESRHGYIKRESNFTVFVSADPTYSYVVNIFVADVATVFTDFVWVHGPEDRIHTTIDNLKLRLTSHAMRTAVLFSQCQNPEKWDVSSLGGSCKPSASSMH